MIRTILQLLAAQLIEYILQVNEDAEEPPVVLGNIGLSTSLGGNESYMQDRIVLSLVNMIEEATMKNGTPYRNGGFQTQIENTPTFLNLFLLFTANFSNPQGGGANNQVPYNNGLALLSRVIEFFQGQNVFTVQNSPAVDIIQAPLLQDLKLSVELYPLTFEQVNHLWGSLGGKQVPFVMYKVRVLPIRRENISRRGAIIQDIQTSIKNNN